MDKAINFFNTTVNPTAITAVTEVLNSTRLSAGVKADEFEYKLKQYGLVNPVTVNSGTVTMHLGLVASGVGPGDEVIIPAQTFIATGMAVLYVGATPVFADISLEDGNISPSSIREKITERTKAIIPVHWAGYPCDMDEIANIAKEFNLSVIEDAAHAFGAEYKGKKVGSISRFTSFSFQAIKHLTTGDGGALCCLSEEDAKLVKRLRWFDIDRENSKVGYLGEREYDATHVGYKYHMNDIAASIGLENLKIVDDKLTRIRNIASYYDTHLSTVPGIIIPKYHLDRKSAYWLYSVRVANRNQFIAKMKEANIPVSVVHLGIHKNTVLGGVREDLINQSAFDNSQINIPIHDGLTDQQVYYIVNKIKEGW